MSIEDETPIDAPEGIQMTTDIVASFVSNNDISIEGLPALISSIHGAVTGLTKKAPPVNNQKSAVPVSRSITDDYIICLENGAKLKMLKRYIRTRFGLSPEQYRKKWNLPADYPMVAPGYGRRRSELAMEFGLGKGNRKSKSNS